MAGISDSAIHALSGAAGGCVATAITYPLVNLSTRAQVASKSENESSAAAALKVVKRDGIFALYDGLTSSLLGMAVTNGLYYWFFEESRKFLLGGSAIRPLTTLESMLSSTVSGAATSIVSNPLWVINTRQTTASTVNENETKKLGILATVARIWNTEGLLGFTAGLKPALILVANPLLQYTLFEQLKNIIISRRKRAGRKSTLTDIDFFVLGALSKLFATGITYPYLTVKSKLQAGVKGSSGVIATFVDIIANDGIEGLYRGIVPKLFQSAFTAAILFLAKERIYNTTVRALALAQKRRI